MSPEAKKLVLVSATSTPVIENREKTVETIKAIETAEAVKTAKAIKAAGTGKDGEKSRNEYLENLAQVPYVWYPITFRKKFVPVLVLFDSSSEVNAIHPTFTSGLSLPIRPIEIKAQKIDDTMLNIFGMIVAAFSMMDKANQIRFFKETFLVANVSPEVIFEMLFFTLSGVDVDFLSWELQ